MLETYFGERVQVPVRMCAVGVREEEQMDTELSVTQNGYQQHLTGKRLHSFLCIVLNGRKRLCKLECDLKLDFEEANLDLDSKHQPTEGP